MEQDKAIEPEIIDQALAKAPKKVVGQYRKAELPLPKEIESCTGISVFGRTIRSFVFSTDLAIIRNCDADAVLAVYPFTCQPAITQGLLDYAERPVFAGVAGSVTTGIRSVELAMQSEMQGALGVVANAATRPGVIASIARSVDIPILVTTGAYSDYMVKQLEAGAQIVNVSAGKETPSVVREIRDHYPDLPIIASGGGTPESIEATIAAGADAISWTPPSMRDLERENMAKNRRVQADSARKYADGRAEGDVEVLKAAAKAADSLQQEEDERARQWISEKGARELSWLFDERLDGDERTLFRQLLAKLLDAPEPTLEEIAARQESDEESLVHPKRAENAV